MHYFKSAMTYSECSLRLVLGFIKKAWMNHFKTMKYNNIQQANTE